MIPVPLIIVFACVEEEILVTLSLILPRSKAQRELLVWSHLPSRNTMLFLGVSGLRLEEFLQEKDNKMEK